MVTRVLGGERVSDVARQMDVSRQTASKWMTRRRRGEPVGDRSSRPRRLTRLTAPANRDRVLEARSGRLLAPLALAAETGVPARTCARIVRAAGLPRLADVDRVTGEERRRGPVTRERYERERPGETRATACAFTGRCLSFFRGLGVEVKRVMTDNGPAYRSGDSDAMLEGLGIGHRHARPYSPWQNGEAERMNGTLAQEWQYVRAYGSEAERAEALPAFLEHYNWERPHSACRDLPPFSRIDGVNNVMAHNS